MMRDREVPGPGGELLAAPEGVCGRRSLAAPRVERAALIDNAAIGNRTIK